MKKPSHLEMAGWGLLALLLAALLVSYWKWETGFPAFVLFLPLAASRATGQYANIPQKYFFLIFFGMIALGAVAPSFEISRSTQFSTLEHLPSINLTAKPVFISARLSIFFSSCILVFSSTLAIRMPLSRTDIVAIFRSMIIFAMLMGFHLLFVHERVYLKPGEAYKRSEVLVRALIDFQTLVLIYAGFYVALFYDLVKDANKSDTSSER